MPGKIQNNISYINHIKFVICMSPLQCKNIGLTILVTLKCDNPVKHTDLISSCKIKFEPYWVQRHIRGAPSLPVSSEYLVADWLRFIIHLMLEDMRIRVTSLRHKTPRVSVSYYFLGSSQKSVISAHWHSGETCLDCRHNFVWVCQFQWKCPAKVNGRKKGVYTTVD